MRIVNFPHLSTASAGGDIGVSNENLMSANWKSLFPKEKGSIEDPDASKLSYHKPLFVNGKTIIPESDFEEEIRVCEKNLVGHFVGSRLKFHSVEIAMKKIWNLKGGFRLTINGDSIFLFEFDLVEDKISAMEKGSVFISNSLFLIRPWHLFVEQEIQEMKTFPIWLNLMNIPIHLWNAKGISMIASVLGIPLLTDKHTSARTRMSFARICIEIEADFDYPSSIPLSFGGKDFEVSVEYTWKPPTCLSCASFGHSRGKCTKDVVKCNMDPASKVLNMGWIPSVNNGDKEGVGQMRETQGMSKEGVGQMRETQGMSKEGVIVNGFKETSEKAETGMPCIESAYDKGSSMMDKDTEATSAPVEIMKTKKKRSTKIKETLSIEEIQEGINMNLNPQPVIDGTITSSSDPSIPPGFENQNRFHVLEEDEEVATSQLGLEDEEVSISKPASPESNRVKSKKVKSKAKVTGMFPSGTLSTKQKNVQKSRAPNKISTSKLMDLGSLWGLDFPPLEVDREDMFHNLEKNHDDLVIGDDEESST